VCNPAFIHRNVGGNTLTLGVSPHALALGYSDPADPNFEKKNKGEYDCHHLHIHFRQKSSDTIANTKIPISTKRYWDYVTTASVLNDHATRRRRIILKTLKGLKALQQRTLIPIIKYMLKTTIAQRIPRESRLEIAWFSTFRC
jgi:ribosomal protein S18